VGKKGGIKKKGNNEEGRKGKKRGHVREG